MSVKIIAIGNRLMGDDGLAIHTIEKLSKKFEKSSIKVIIGETDFEYCLGKVEENDYIIIVDATSFNIEPGTVTVNSLKDIYRLSANQSLLSQHGYSLIKAFEISYRFIDGIIVGIEGENFEYSLSLSNDIKDSFDNICNKVYETICSKIEV